MKSGTRKDNHVDICLTGNVGYAGGGLFGEVELLHNPLPELDYSAVDTECKFLGKLIPAPIIINSMTGGTEKALQLNRKLAQYAEKYSIPMGLGSLRPLLEDKKLLETFQIRDIAPTVPLFGNIGMGQVRKTGKELIDGLKWAADKLKLDGMAVHLNPLQEIVQPEGDSEFSGCLEGIRELKKELGIPIIVKETGAGINEFVANALDSIGIDYIDVNGAGGTSWSKVEYMRKSARAEGFEEWGTQTAFLVPTVGRAVKKAKLIAGGGIYDGIIMAKAIALGADYCSGARNYLIAVAEARFDQEYSRILEQLRVTMLLTGSKDLEHLKKANLIIHSKLRSMLLSANLDCSQFYFR